MDFGEDAPRTCGYLLVVSRVRTHVKSFYFPTSHATSNNPRVALVNWLRHSKNKSGYEGCLCGHWCSLFNIQVSFENWVKVIVVVFKRVVKVWKELKRECSKVLFMLIEEWMSILSLSFSFYFLYVNIVDHWMRDTWSEIPKD